MAIKTKGKGKYGGARVIIFSVLTDVEDGYVFFLLFYDKKYASPIKTTVTLSLPFSPLEWSEVAMASQEQVNGKAAGVRRISS